MIAHGLLLLGVSGSVAAAAQARVRAALFAQRPPPPKVGIALGPSAQDGLAPAGTPPGAHCSALPSRPSSVASGGAPGWPPPQNCWTFLGYRQGRRGQRAVNSTCHVEADPGCARRRPYEPLSTHTCTHTGPCGPPKTGEALAWSWPMSPASPWDRGCLMDFFGRSEV